MDFQSIALPTELRYLSIRLEVVQAGANITDISRFENKWIQNVRARGHLRSLSNGSGD